MKAKFWLTDDDRSFLNDIRKFESCDGGCNVCPLDKSFCDSIYLDNYQASICAKYILENEVCDE